MSNLDSAFRVRLEQIENGLDGVLQETAALVTAEAKRTVQVRKGTLQRSIKFKASKFTDGGYIVIATGKNRGGGGNHAHLIEYGHVKVLWGRRTGERVQPFPFMRPAAEKGTAFLMTRLKGIK